uniref:Protein-lysine N-methyltransferase ORF32355 n=1 Tax=Arion vulgaris TaxID=1028688 RepID=A0A0B6YRR5_9EUPU
MTEDDADFQSSILGTQQYWDDAYNRELKAYEDVGDVGEIWFGEEVQERLIRWLTEKSQLPPTARLLDIGCGNGMLLVELRREGFTDLTGVDYSEGAVTLSKSIAQKEGITDIKIKTCDILSSESIADLCRSGSFDVCVDKGTYDAISLRDTHLSSDRVRYRQNVRSLLTEGGLLMVTSCNWTRDQLLQHFHEDFELFNEIPAPKYTFGGKTGQTVTNLVLKTRTAAQM